MGRTEAYERWRESQAEQRIATGCTDTNTVRELLILSCHSSQLAKQFFETRLEDEGLLEVLLGLAVDDYSGDAQMTASYWISRFPVELLRKHVQTLQVVAANEWGSVSVHACRALAAIHSEPPRA